MSLNFYAWLFWEESFRMAQRDIEAIKGNIRRGNERAARFLAREAASAGLFVIFGGYSHRPHVMPLASDSSSSTVV